MFWGSFLVNGRPSLENYQEVFTDYRNALLFLNSLLLASLTTVLAALIGIFTGFLLGKTDLPMKGLYRNLFFLPFIIPSYIYGLAWANLLGKTGPLNKFLSGLPFLTEEGISGFIYGTFGASMVLGLSFFPIVMLITEGSLSRVDSHLEESGLVQAGRGRVLRDILFPLAAPGLISGMLIIFILALSEFGVPFLLGVKVLTTEIFTQFSAFYNEKAAVALSIPFVVITVSIMLLERGFLKERSFETLGKRGAARTHLYPLGRWKIPCLVFCSLILCLAVFFPLISLIIDSGSLDAYRKAFLLARQAMTNTLVFGAIGATLLTLLGLVVGYFSEKDRLSLGKGLEFSTLMLFALPATVIGVGLIKLWNRPQVPFPWVYGSFLIIIIGYIARFSPIALRLMADSYKQVSTSLAEVGEVLGASWWRLMGEVLIPLVGRGIMITWIISFIFCLGELGTTILVYPPGHETLPITLFTVMANSPVDVVSALSVELVLILLIPVALCFTLFHFVRRWLYWF